MPLPHIITLVHVFLKISRLLEALTPRSYSHVRMVSVLRRARVWASEVAAAQRNSTKPHTQIGLNISLTENTKFWKRLSGISRASLKLSRPHSNRLWFGGRQPIEPCLGARSCGNSKWLNSLKALSWHFSRSILVGSELQARFSRKSGYTKILKKIYVVRLGLL